MLSVLKYAHLLTLLLAVSLFVITFYWQQRGHQNAQKVIFKKALLHTHLTVLLFALLLMWGEQINPFAENGLWLIEKFGAFIAYILMVSAALNKNKRRGMQVLAFIGAFGWLVYAGQLVISKQAILLVG